MSLFGDRNEVIEGPELLCIESWQVNEHKIKRQSSVGVGTRCWQWAFGICSWLSDVPSPHSPPVRQPWALWLRDHVPGGWLVKALKACVTKCYLGNWVSPSWSPVEHFPLKILTLKGQFNSPSSHKPMLRTDSGFPTSKRQSHSLYSDNLTPVHRTFQTVSDLHFWLDITATLYRWGSEVKWSEAASVVSDFVTPHGL